MVRTGDFPSPYSSTPVILEAAMATCLAFPLASNRITKSPGRTCSTGTFLAGFIISAPKIVSLTRLAKPPHATYILVKALSPMVLDA